jgi:hypothetical protein
MRIRLAIPDRLVTPAALEAALEATTLANAEAISRGEVPSLSDAISRGVKWQPEPYLDGEHFDLSHQVAARGWGDCDDLAPWLAGELRASGDDPDARPRVYKTGKDRWHVVVETGDGKILDPSEWAGMRKRSGQPNKGVSGTIARPFARPGTGALTVMPHAGAWWSRCDLPWPDGCGHLASHARASTPEQALEHALRGAVACGDQIESPLTERALACGEILLSDASEVGSIFSSLGKIVKKALPMASSLIPGGGLATSALSALTGKRKRGKMPAGALQHPSGAVTLPLERDRPDHGQHMTITYHPAQAPGPVVMRF